MKKPKLITRYRVVRLEGDARHSEGLRKLAELMKEYNMHFLHDADALTIESAGDSRTFYTTDGFFTEDNIEGEEL